MTNDLVRRTWEHRNEVVDGFTKDHQVHRLVYYEEYTDIRDAIRREKHLKKWKCAWKIRLVEESNPRWIDLYDRYLEAHDLSRAWE